MQIDRITCGQNNLAVVRCERAGVVDILCRQHQAAIAGAGRQLGTLLHRDLHGQRIGRRIEHDVAIGIEGAAHRVASGIEHTQSAIRLQSRLAVLQQAG